MAIQRWDPVRDLLHLQERVNQMFEDVLTRSGVAHDVEPVSATAWKPALDLLELDDRFEVRVDLPGVPQEDVHVDVDESGLHVRGERRPDTSASRDAYLRADRPVGKFHVPLSLPPSVDRTRIEARHRDGVLLIVLPKREPRVDRLRVPLK
jgi:HSP20 family protein